MSEYGKRVAKKMSEYMGNPDSIDKEVSDIQGAIEGVEVRGALAAGVKKSFDKSKDAEQRSIEQTDRVDTLIQENPQPSEVVDARLGYPTLRDKLNSVDSQLADIDQQKADKSYVNDLFENLGQLEVKGSYDSVGDLTNAYPSGSTGLFEVDGGLYAWNGSEWAKVFDLEVMPWADFLTEQDEEWVV